MLNFYYMTVTLLAIDDEADMLETYASVLGKKYQLLTALSGAAALPLLDKNPIAVVLLDLRLPDENGLAILKQLKAADQSIEVIMVSASKDLPSAVEAMKLGAFDYLTKPFHVNEPLTTVRRAISPWGTMSP